MLKGYNDPGSVYKPNGVILSAGSSDLHRLIRLVYNTYHMDEVKGYMFGSIMARGNDMQTAGLIAREELKQAGAGKKDIIFQTQIGVDDESMEFARTCKVAGLDAVVLQPTTGWTSQLAHMSNLRQINIDVIIDGMTHLRAFIELLQFENRNKPIDETYVKAARHGFTNFGYPAHQMIVHHTLRRN